MAKPRITDYHTTPTPRDAMRTVQAQYSPATFSVFFAIVDKTLGFGKLDDWIAISQLMKATGLSNRAVITAANALHKDGWIHKYYKCPDCGFKRPQYKHRCKNCGCAEWGDTMYRLHVTSEIEKKWGALNLLRDRVDKGGYEHSSQGYEHSSQGYEHSSQEVVNSVHIQVNNIPVVEEAASTDVSASPLQTEKMDRATFEKKIHDYFADLVAQEEARFEREGGRDRDFMTEKYIQDSRRIMAEIWGYEGET